MEAGGGVKGSMIDPISQSSLSLEEGLGPQIASLAQAGGNRARLEDADKVNLLVLILSYGLTSMNLRNPLPHRIVVLICSGTTDAHSPVWALEPHLLGSSLTSPIYVNPVLDTFLAPTPPFRFFTCIMGTVLVLALGDWLIM